MSTIYQELDDQMRSCQKCASIMTRFPIDPRRDSRCVAPRPIVSGIRVKPIMLIGQAPGLTEYKTGKPFQGDAGQGIRTAFEETGISRSNFDELVYSSAVVKCFPGSKPNLRAGKVREDVFPSAQMIRNCQAFFDGQIKLVDPKIIVTLGGLPLKTYLKMTERKANEAKLENFVGTKEQWNGRTVIFFPHTSGASRWLNSNENRLLYQKAKNLLKMEIAAKSIANPN